MVASVGLQNICNYLASASTTAAYSLNSNKSNIFERTFKIPINTDICYTGTATTIALANAPANLSIKKHVSMLIYPIPSLMSTVNAPMPNM